MTGLSELLARLARRVRDDPFFLASLLALYAESEGIDDAGLACPADTLTALRLCRAPREDAAGFREDIGRLAARFGVDADRLIEVVRRGQALRRMRGAAPAARGYLMAARDGEEPPAEGGGASPGGAP
jgi:hypothetical protein